MKNFWILLLIATTTFTGRLLWAAAVPPSTEVVGASECKLDKPLREIQLRPQQLKSILATHTSSIKTPMDLICCLPEGYKAKTLVGHSSLAGQPGQPDSPRVLVYNDQTRKVFSINGNVPMLDKDGKPVLDRQGNPVMQTQGTSVEFFIDNPDTKKTEYYDIACTNKGCRVGRANPDACMACHGYQGKETPTGGKPIFDFAPRQWPRFTGGLNLLGEHCSDLKAEGELNDYASARAEKAYEELPQFNCLKPLDKSGLSFIAAPVRGELFEMDEMVIHLNGRRFIQELQVNPNYRMYKYLWLGEDLGCLNDRNSNLPAIMSWINPAAQSKWNEDSYLKMTVKGANSAMEACLKSLTKIDQTREAIHREINEQLRRAKRGEPFTFVMDESIRACSGTSTKEEFCTSLLKRYAFDKAPWDQLAKYKMDTILNSPRRELIEGDSFSWTKRFVFEANGSDEMSRWSTTVRPGDFTRIGVTRPERMKWMAQDYNFRQMDLVNKLGNEGAEAKKVVCEELRQKSIQATATKDTKTKVRANVSDEHGTQ